ncbi:MAG: GNAT family N-acetyltransferase [Pseudomonadota bacterium]
MLPQYQRQLIECLQAAKGKNVHRKVIVIDALSAALIDTIRHQCSLSCLFISSSTSLECDIDATQQALVNQLGNEYDTVIYDALRNFDANIFYGAAGLVGRSGCFLIAVEDAAIADIGNDENYSFQSMLMQRLSETSVFALYSKSKIITCEETSIDSEFACDAFTLSQRQSNAITEISDNVVSSGTSTSIVLGQRGRGKSTVLSEIIHCLYQADKNIIYTSVHRNNCHIIDERIASMPTDANCKIQFLAPDHILECQMTEGTVLVIDEVASLAPRLLNALFEKFNHVICAGTTQGYEGSARGFAIRRLQQLDNPSIYMLSEPFRWHKQDPIERSLQDLLPTEYEDENNNSIKAEDAVFKIVDKAELLHNKSSYKRVFSLLIEAHYQTTPLNIQRIIDDDSHIVVSLCAANKILGLAVLVKEEKSVDMTFNQQVALGKRRKKGNLFQQNIALHILDPLIMEYSFLRVHRIVVPRAQQKNGMGSLLLTNILDYIQGSNYILCTTFGITDELHRFWLKNNYALIKVGEKIDAASGTVSGFYLHNTQLDYMSNQSALLETYEIQKRYVRSLNLPHSAHYPQINACDDTVRITQTSNANIVRSLELYIRSNVNYDRIKHFIYSIAKTLDADDILVLIEQLAKKGLSKERRSELEWEVKEKIKNPAVFSRVLNRTKR